MIDWIKNNYTRLVEIRHYLHQHPELGYEEYNTSDYLKNLLKQAGVDLTTPQAVEETFAVLAGYVERLEQLISE